MAKILSVINHKGGVGKTVTAYCLAAIFAKKGLKTLLVDNDQQGSLTLYAGFDPREEFEATLCDVYAKVPAYKAIIDTKYENLSLIPSNLGLAMSDMTLAQMGQDGRFILKDALDPLKDLFDVIIIDNPPAFSFLTVNALSCSDYVLVPCQTSPLSTYALPDIFTTIENAQIVTNSLTCLGVLATLHRKQSKAACQELEQMRENYNVIGVIKESSVVTNAVIKGMPVTYYDKNAEVSKQYLQVAETILEEMGLK